MNCINHTWAPTYQIVLVQCTGSVGYAVKAWHTCPHMHSYAHSMVTTRIKTWYVQFPSCWKHGTLCRYISVHQPSAEISSGLDSNPTCWSAPTHYLRELLRSEITYLLTELKVPFPATRWLCNSYICYMAVCGFMLMQQPMCAADTFQEGKVTSTNNH